MVGEPVRAVVIDDTELNIRIYGSMLRRAGVTEAIGFTTSADAQAWCGENEAALVVVDYKMAAPNGLKFIEWIKQLRHHTDTSIVMITGDEARSVRYQALELGVNDFLTKPVDPPEFIGRIRNLLVLREQRRALTLQTAYLTDQATWLAYEVRRATSKLRERERETIYGLTRAAEFRDNETGMHIVRMGMFSAALGKAIGLSGDDQDMLQLAAPMHDVGKVATPDDILLKQGPLTADEWKIMREHTIAGHEILRASSSELLQRGAEIALSHHEKFDGTGYPYRVAGEEIPLWGRICSICDVFDALTSERPYKRAWPIDRAVEQMGSAKGTHFDPRLLGAFLSIISEVSEIKQRYADAA
jgi:putative two-component system response regulator